MSHSLLERAKIAAWYEWTKSCVAVQRKFHAEFGRNREAPDHHSIQRWHAALMETGSVKSKERERQKAARSEETVATITEHFVEQPTSSTRRAATSLYQSLIDTARVASE